MVLLLILFAVCLIHQKVHLYQFSCPSPSKPENILVHLIPHSHQDVGWLKTVDQYYYGLNDSIQHAGVRYIYDTVIQELNRDESKRFVVVEIVFFRRWYIQQSTKIKDLVMLLIQKGQLSFANGGWVMSDEACTHYRATIDQMTIGRSFINKHFNILPNVSWQIDPFGHSSVHIELMYLMNINGAIINRLDYRTGAKMRSNKTNEFLWAFDNDNDQEIMLTSRMYNHYSPPPGFCFDEFCADDPIIDDENENTYLNNAEQKVSDILTYLCEQTKAFNSRHILLPMGSDFHYQNAHHTFRNVDSLMRNINQFHFGDDRDKIEISYSTPECYMSAIKMDLHNLSTFNKDFLPLCHRPHSCWSSLYTSRPGLKKLERISGSLVQTLRQLIFLSSNNAVTEDSIFPLVNAHAIIQHHDAITGTCKQHVADDYKQMISKAITYIKVNTLSKVIFNEHFPMDICLLANISDCEVSNYDYIQSFMIYNPSIFNMSTVCYIPVKKGNIKYHILTADGNEVISQTINLIEGLQYLPERQSNTTSELAFKCDLPAMTMSIFQLNSTELESLSKPHAKNDMKISLKSSIYNIEVNSANKIYIENIIEKLSTTMSVEVGYYEDFSGDNINSENQSSGAYVFRPLVYKQLSQVNFQERNINDQNSLVQQISSQFVDSEENIEVNVTLRLTFDGQIEIHGLVGSLLGHRNLSRTLVIRYNTNIDQRENFTVDLNCRRERTQKMCPSHWFIPILNDSIAECYRPICGYMYITAAPFEISIVTDRTQGGTVFYRENEGSVFEMAVAKRSVTDDGLGMDEVLDERYENGNGVWTKFQHNILVTSTNTGSLYRRQLLHTINNPNTMFFSKSNTLPAKIDLLPLQIVLPRGLSLLSIVVKDKAKNLISTLIRIEHMFETDEFTFPSEGIVLDIDSMFDKSLVKVISVQETSLDGQSPISPVISTVTKGNTQVLFTAMSIKTFNIKLKIC